MPYYITDKADSCSGWAVVKTDGEVIGCHKSKRGAINQAVAISLAEGEEFKGERKAGGDKIKLSDIDGTLVAGGNRRNAVWDYLQSVEGKLFILTGRPESTRSETESLLGRLNIRYSRLIMNDGSTANSPEFKKAKAEELLKIYDIVVAVENDASTLRKFRELGISAKSPSSVPSTRSEVTNGTDSTQERDSSIEQRAAVGSIKIGDYVTFTDRKQDKYGEVIEIVTNGAISVPGSGIHLNGSVLEPAVLIQIYVDGIETNEFVAKHMSAVQWAEKVTPASEEIQSEDPQMTLDPQSRAVNLTPPAYMRAAARAGLRYYEEGKGGDGLVEATIREARAMAKGNVTADKWVRIRAWISRHLSDLDSPAARPDSPDYPSAGVVAHLLWGSGPSKRAAQRALSYAEGVVARLEAENRGRAKGEALSKIETRTTPIEFEVREDSNGMTFEGYAAVFNTDSAPLPFIERIAPGAFTRSLESRNDIKLLWNHDTGSVLGSSRAGTLKLWQDERGLRVSGQLPNTTAGRDAAELIKRGDVDSMSFGFSVPQGGDEWSADGSQRTLKSVRLHEVSIVAFPAYSSTAGTTTVRGLDSVAVRAEVDADALADAWVKVEEGQVLTEDEGRLLKQVVDSLLPEKQSAEEPQSDVSMLELKKKKLELLLKAL